MMNTPSRNFDPLIVAAPYWAIGLLSLPRHQRAKALLDTLPEAELLVRGAFAQLKRYRSDDLLCLAGRAVIDACPSLTVVESPSIRVLAALTSTIPSWRRRLPPLSPSEHLPWPRQWVQPSAGERLVQIADNFTRLNTAPSRMNP